MEPLSRRLFLSGIGAAALTRPMVAAPACTLATEQEEGPYYVDAAQVRRDITEGREGTPLQLRIALVDSHRCLPIENAAIDIWHCDALGIYSGFTAVSPDGGLGPGPERGGPGRRGPGGPDGRGAGGPPPDFARGEFGPGPGMPPPRFGGRGRNIDATRFLRGIQVTGKDGIARFDTLYPGWYSGRAIHVHLKVHISGSVAGEKYTGGHVSHTGQLFFDEDVTNDIAKLQPYSRRFNIRRTLQSEDGIFVSQNGKSTLLALERLQPRSNQSGFSGIITLAVDPEATPAPAGRGGRGPFGGPR
jgi:protocatechuate 3,4-dioxygenase beta subunit